MQLDTVKKFFIYKATKLAIQLIEKNIVVKNPVSCVAHDQ
jgi:hypothetical protein